MRAMANKQRGVSMSGFITAVVILILLAIAGMKIAPAYIQDKTIKSKFDEVAHDPELKSVTVREIQEAFRKRISASDINAIKAEDVQITKDADGITLSVSYSVKIPLIANASLLLEFNPSSASK